MNHWRRFAPVIRTGDAEVRRADLAEPFSHMSAASLRKILVVGPRP
jgi:hypothetical protein